MLYGLQDLLSDERDILYRIGEVKGEAKATKKTDFTIAGIASLVEVSQYFVRKTKKSMA